jgi:hypothetical protein
VQGTRLRHRHPQVTITISSKHISDNKGNKKTISSSSSSSKQKQQQSRRRSEFYTRS